MHNLALQLREKGVDVGDVVFYINSQCNLRCKHCYVGNELLSRDIMYSFDDYRDILCQFPDLDRLTLLGGEPLLHPEVIAILRYAGSQLIHEKRMTSNLTSLNHDQIEALIDSGFRVCVSLDGVDAKTNDWIRGKGTYDTVVANLKHLRSYTDNIEITHTLNKTNVGTFGQFLSLLRELRIGRLNLHRMNARGNALTIIDEVLSPTDWRSFIADLESMSDTQGGSIQVRYELGFVTESEYQELTKSYNYHVHGLKSFYTNGNRGRIVIYPDRRVYISSEAFGTDAFIGILGSQNIFQFNESSMNEITLARKGLEVGPLVNTLLRGDLNYPRALSVSFRKKIVV